VKVAQKNCGGGVPKSPSPLEGPPTPDPLGSDPFVYQSIALDLRIPNIQFLMGLTRDVQKLCSLGPPVCCNHLFDILPDKASTISRTGSHTVLRSVVALMITNSSLLYQSVRICLWLPETRQQPISQTSGWRLQPVADNNRIVLCFVAALMKRKLSNLQCDSVNCCNERSDLFTNTPKNHRASCNNY